MQPVAAMPWQSLLAEELMPELLVRVLGLRFIIDVAPSDRTPASLTAEVTIVDDTTGAGGQQFLGAAG